MTCAAKTGFSDPPAPLGLLFLGLTVLVFNLHQSGLFPLNAMVLGSGILYGALGQIAIGLLEWRRSRSVFGAVAYTALGLFWLSMISLVILPGSGVGQFPSSTALAAYLAMWGTFAFVLFLGTLRFDPNLQLTFGLLVLFFGLLVTGQAAGQETLRTIAAWTGVLAGLVAFGTALTRLLAAARDRSMGPLGLEVQKRA